MTRVRLLRLATGDNVYIAVTALQPGEAATSDGRTVAVAEPVQLGHKVAAAPIAAGDQVTRCGVPIGSARSPIATGQWVHTPNLGSDYIPTVDHRGGDA